MQKEEVIIRFDEVSFGYDEKHLLLDEVSFSIRNNSKITIIGQNGAGKSTTFKLLSGELKPTDGMIHMKQGVKIGIAEQIVPAEKLGLSVLDYFKSAFEEEFYGIEKNIKQVLYTVNLDVPLEKTVSELSGGQKSRLLLAYALIQEPDILLLDEPTNNLDDEGIAHLTTFLVMYEKNCIVISHDTDFLNSFTDGVLNLDVHTRKIEQFVGNYYDVVDQIEAQIERDRLKNARIEKSVADRFAKVNKLGGKSVAMRRLARKVREDIEEDRQEIVAERKVDRPIAAFKIPAQHCPSTVIEINNISMLKDHKIVTKKVHIDLHRGQRILIAGPNGIGKSTLLKAFLRNEGALIAPGVRVGYYSQDFSELDFKQTALESLQSVMLEGTKNQEIFAAAGRFMLPGNILSRPVSALSEGQKGLLCYARFLLQQPGLLIMDEPTNHINFRHIPVIADALNDYKGAMIMISHLPEFVSKVRVDQVLDLRKA